MVPWVHINVRTNGQAFPCCNADHNLPLGSLRDSALAGIWNSEPLRQMRLNMLSDKDNSQCARCYELEKFKFPSPRRDLNKAFAHHYPFVEKTEEDGSLPRINLPYLDIRFSNVCNFKCRYCDPHQSSAWHADRGLLGWDERAPAILTPTADPDDLWRQIEPHIPRLEAIYFSGGEPLLAHEHYRILDALAKLEKFDVALRYNTNFSFPPFPGADVMALWSRFKRVDVSASLDGMGRRGEYIRKNQHWDDVIRNRERMMQVCSKVKFSIAPTLSVMNVLHLPDFHRDWLEKGYIGPGDIQIGMLRDPEEYRIQILPEPLKKKVAEAYESHMGYLSSRYGEGASHALGQFQAAINLLDSQDMTHLLGKFRERTRRIDQGRGESFKKTFPELAELSV